MEIRSFLAFELPGSVRSLLTQVLAEARKTALDVRWVKVDNIHLTVVFMGSTSVDLMDPIGRALSGVCARHTPFRVSLRGTGVFGSRRNPRVLWVGLEGDLDRLGVFRRELQRALQPLGFKAEERPLSAHLTLGRFRRGAAAGGNALENLLHRHRELVSPSWTLAELVLFRSDLRPGGAEYTPLARFPLGGVKPEPVDQERMTNTE